MLRGCAQPFRGTDVCAARRGVAAGVVVRHRERDTVATKHCCEHFTHRERCQIGNALADYIYAEKPQPVVARQHDGAFT